VSSTDDLVEKLCRDIATNPTYAVLHTVWCAAVDAASSEDFRGVDGELDEQAYLTYQRNVLDAAAAALSQHRPRLL
jgi:hypothetical protein